MQQAKQKKRGAALISALFITALAAVLATALAVHERLLIHEGGLIIRSDKLYLALQGVQRWGKAAAVRYAAQWAVSKGQIRPLARPLNYTMNDGVKLRGELSSAQGRFNLNNLIYTANEPRFTALLLARNPGMSKETARSISAAVSAWMTTGADDRYYLSLPTPYRSPQSPMANVTELRLVKGVTPRIYQSVYSLVTALPVPKQLTDSYKKTAEGMLGPLLTPVDINAIDEKTPGVLLALNPSLTVQQAQRILACRKNMVRDLSVFIANCVTRYNYPALNGLTISSNYYQLNASATTPDAHTVWLSSLLFTTIDQRKRRLIGVQWQSYY